MYVDPHHDTDGSRYFIRYFIRYFWLAHYHQSKDSREEKGVCLMTMGSKQELKYYWCSIYNVLSLPGTTV